MIKKIKSVFKNVCFSGRKIKSVPILKMADEVLSEYKKNLQK